MTDQFQDINSGHIKADGGGDTLVDPAISIQCMETTMGYYMALRRIIDGKISHAHKATLKRIAELKEISPETDDGNIIKIKKYQRLTKHLKELGLVLEEAQIGIKELEQMNEVFHFLPDKIKLYYDHMIRLDKELMALIEEISSAEYKTAYQQAQRVIDMVQDGKNVLSGCPTQEEYADPGLQKVLQPIKRDLQDIDSDGAVERI